MDNNKIDYILRDRYCKLLAEYPEYTGNQLKILFFELYGDKYTEEDYERVRAYILDAYSKDI